MDSVKVDRDGIVRCPRCGSTQFNQKRTGKAKWAGVMMVGVGVAAMPKRLHCMGCGKNLKTQGALDRANSRMDAKAADKKAEKAELEAKVVPRGAAYGPFETTELSNIEPGDKVRSMMITRTVAEVRPGRKDKLILVYTDGSKDLSMPPETTWKVSKPLVENDAD